MNPIIKIMMITMCINIVAFVSMGDTIWNETFVGNSTYSLFDTTNIDLGDTQSIKTGPNVETITRMNMTSDSATLGTWNELVYTNPLSIVWRTVRLFFKFFFALPMLMLQMNMPTYLVLMFGVPIAFIYLFAIVFLVRGVNP